MAHDDHTPGPGRAKPRIGCQPVVALGEFDGFHLGHRQLLHAAREVAVREQRPLITVVMDDRSVHTRLATPEERCRAAIHAGCGSVNVVAVDPSNRPEAAVQLVDLLLAQFHPGVVVMACLPGDNVDARYPSLRDEIRRRDVPLVEVDRWHDADREPITSTRIVEALGAGDVSRAASWLGRPYALVGEVQHGAGLGRTIGFPTANLLPPAGRVVPGRGVYAATVTLADRSEHIAAVNIGVRPTVELHGQLMIEAHLLDFDADIYGQDIRVAFHRWLRGEQQFGSLDKLVAQLAKDTTRVRLGIA